MDNRIHFFSSLDVIPKKVDSELLGIRGRQANEFAELGFPILPGFIINTQLASQLDKVDIKKDVKFLLEKCASIVGKKFGDPENPMLIKIVVSSNLAVSNYPTLHNFGLVRSVIPGFAKWVGETFAAHEVLFMVRGILKIEEQLASIVNDTEKLTTYKDLLAKLAKEIDSEHPAKSALEYMDFYGPYVPAEFFDSADNQLMITLRELSKLLSLDSQNDNDTALMIQPMVYGNYGKDSCSGAFFSRNIVTGEKKLQGEFYREKFNEIGATGQDIEKIGPEHLKQLQKIAWTLEDKFKEIRQIRFTVEKGKLWLIEQRPVDQKSTQADIKLLLDLAKRKIIDNTYVVKAIQPPRLNEILHPIIDPSAIKGLPKWSGGIAGAPGAAIGRVYFSTDALLEAHKVALQKNEDHRFILVMPATFADDVKAIEVATGVLSCEGGYSAHASVVARQYGKVSVVIPAMKIRGKKATIGDISFSEGDYITLNVPYYGDPTVYLGQAKLIEPDPSESGLLEFISIAKQFVNGFHVRANADSPRDANLALSFGAEGIGLCRTEHMFFHKDRINVFREMILSDSLEERSTVLEKLRPMQRDDFYGIFKAMAGKEVTIRLLDAPLHEFLPHNDEELAAFMTYLEKTKGKKPNKAELLARIEALAEFNPMLGHRGCRIAVSYPEIYAMQVKAIFEAAFKLRDEKIEVFPEIMVPIVMNANELKLIAFGKKIEGKNYHGIVDVEEEIRSELQKKPIPYRIGTMIELPAAALGAGEIAKYGQFFSFGTNDLTQTTLGISRDDFTSFMPDYTLFDLLEGNPFSTLDPRVKELIVMAVERGRMTRPDLVCGLCGEHGANPANVRFCIDAGLNYVSCSSYSVPIALLAVAQAELERTN
ncbi:putative PEP-binding protein [Gracilinema caldarium]|uniref:Pyruvate, phosphate dikinase n=1 Tax=Gracilinema caldarium (strain ATCC 51460 / DSM 7334 / H1) TaxID=744872 RepID=F8F0E6_GRAC1|nr:putative PEP-binding protein [Gracilinema caldarium]AEJ19290.1 Pyruvate, phosphate dikinase [Gracilinema caldarium DSM 7334]